MPVASMTPEQLTAVLGAVAVLVVAVGGLIKSLVSVRAEVKSARSEVGEVLVKAKSIEKATDGAASTALAVKEALERTVEGLRKQLREEIGASVAAALVAKQAASDVQSAMRTEPPRDPEGT